MNHDHWDNRQFTQLRVRTCLLPALAEALALARNTALMCEEPRCRDLFEELRLAVMAISPAHSEMFDGGKWSEAAAAAAAGAAVSVTVSGEDRFWDPTRPNCEILIEAEAAAGRRRVRTLSTRRLLKADAERIAAEIREHFAMLAPLDA